MVAVSGFGSWLKNTKRQPSREICAPPQTIVSTGSQISVPCVSCSTAWIRLRESPRDSSIVHRDHETATKRSADSFVREFRDFRSRGHGCPRSWQRFTERLDARVRGNDLRKFEERPGGTSREIARRFYAGNAVDAIRVPKGRLNEPADTLRQPSLRDLSRRGRLPSVETLGWAIVVCPFGTGPRHARLRPGPQNITCFTSPQPLFQSASVAAPTAWRISGTYNRRRAQRGEVQGARRGNPVA